MDSHGGTPAGRIRIGLSGWAYKTWRGAFYPQGLAQRRELEYVAERFDTVELNGTFYSLRRPRDYASWYGTTPPGFQFAVKGSRYITHVRRLRDIDVALANFLASGVLALEDKLGPLLWQLPPAQAYDRSHLEAFLSRLPRTMSDAVGLALGHDEWLQDRSYLAPAWRGTLRHALEPRHPSFDCADAYALLRDHDVALVTSDGAGRWPCLETATSSFAYVRLHGHEELYVSSYGEEALGDWAQRLQGWAAEGRDVYVYFDNDVRVAAPWNALRLAELLGVGPLMAGHAGAANFGGEGSGG